MRPTQESRANAQASLMAIGYFLDARLSRWWAIAWQSELCAAGYDCWTPRAEELTPGRRQVLGMVVDVSSTEGGRDGAILCRFFDRPLYDKRPWLWFSCVPGVAATGARLPSYATLTYPLPNQRDVHAD